MVDLDLPHPLLEEDGVVDVLTTGKDLLASDEDIVGVGQLRVLRIRHGVKGRALAGNLSVEIELDRAVTRSAEYHLPRM